MSETAFTVPRLGWEIPKPTFWDLVAVTLLVLSLAIAGWGWVSINNMAPGESVPGWLGGFWTFAQLTISVGGLMVLGKTAKQGTIHGNLAAVLAGLMGFNGVFLAAALSIIG